MALQLWKPWKSTNARREPCPNRPSPEAPVIGPAHSPVRRTRGSPLPVAECCYVSRLPRRGGAGRLGGALGQEGSGDGAGLQRGGVPESRAACHRHAVPLQLAAAARWRPVSQPAAYRRRRPLNIIGHGSSTRRWLPPGPQQRTVASRVSAPAGLTAQPRPSGHSSSFPPQRPITPSTVVSLLSHSSDLAHQKLTTDSLENGARNSRKINKQIHPVFQFRSGRIFVSAGSGRLAAEMPGGQSHPTSSHYQK